MTATARRHHPRRFCGTLLAATLGVAGVGLGAAPATATPVEASPAIVSSATTPPEGKARERETTEYATQGVKSWVVKQVLKQIAGMIRRNVDRFIRLGGQFLDNGAEAALRSHSGRIADVIDDVAEFPGITTHLARQQTYQRLSQFLDHGTANVIANAVEGVLWILL